ncbi:adenosylcobinamide-phosphate synthase CbiB [Algirhabdus cladophorae]|uniref:adenosylcobinamide-phosphate synthase CbiB n=1 Tax=Algirhabdus cladophorae TaxID=3377108 RepID=UPI003B84B5DD
MTLALAMILDALLGEPKWLWDRLPHPAVLMGHLIGRLDQWFNSGPARHFNGILVMLGLVLLAIASGAILAQLGPVVEILIVAILLAQKSLVQHVQAVALGLGQSTQAGRAAVAMIVGRDTKDMDDPAIVRSAIESAAENLSDGIIAPAFWFAIGGLPGLLVYKITNTADSMIGYLTPRHAQFGWAAAKFDDLLNWIPARLTALMIIGPMAYASLRSDAAKHRSPNAGWPEAAMARRLNLALSGPRAYDGVMQDYPWVWPQGSSHGTGKDIQAACTVLWQTWAIALALVIAIGLL